MGTYSVRFHKKVEKLIIILVLELGILHCHNDVLGVADQHSTMYS
jgi:hypothetical protein